MVKDNFVGFWRLVAYQIKGSNGETIYPYERGVAGMLAYDDHRHMSVHIMNPDRPLFASGDIRNGAPEEIKSVFDGYAGYFDTHEVNGDDHTATHRLKCAFLKESLYPSPEKVKSSMRN